MRMQVEDDFVSFIYVKTFKELMCICVVLSAKCCVWSCFLGERQRIESLLKEMWFYTYFILNYDIPRF
jgi:hypothetical protein